MLIVAPLVSVDTAQRRAARTAYAGDRLQG